MKCGTTYAYNRGCRCEPCKDTRRIRYMLEEGGYREHWWKKYVTALYWDAKLARAALRDSSFPAYGVAGAADSSATLVQLEDVEFDALHPPITFREVLRRSSVRD